MDKTYCRSISGVTFPEQPDFGILTAKLRVDRANMQATKQANQAASVGITAASSGGTLRTVYNLKPKHIGAAPFQAHGMFQAIGFVIGLLNRDRSISHTSP